MSTVLCFGTFDGLHPGHEDYFRQAKELGDRLVVVVARDETVKIVKDRASLQDEHARLRAVEAHPLVDEARLGWPGDKYRIIEDIRPDVLLLGYDQQAFTEALEETLRSRGLSCKVMRAKAFQPDIYKSSKLFR
jgi:FAD synthetase